MYIPFKNVPNILRPALKTIINNRSTITTGAGIAGFVICTVSAVRATPKAIALKEIAETKKGEKLTKIETVKTCWKPYIIPTAEGILSIALLIYGKKVDMDAIKSLGAAYAVSERTVNALETKIKEISESPEKAQEVIDKAEGEVIGQIQGSEKDAVRKLNPGEQYFFEPMLGTIFISTEDKIAAAVGMVNTEYAKNGWVTMDDFYNYLGIDREAKVLSDLGWSEFNGPLELLSYSGYKAGDGTLMNLIRYKNKPVRV